MQEGDVVDGVDDFTRDLVVSPQIVVRSEVRLRQIQHTGGDGFMATSSRGNSIDKSRTSRRLSRSLD